MTFTNGGGFVQANTQIIAEEFTSSNFSNANQTGFDLNSGATTDSEGTPPNTIQVYSNLIVGPPTGNHLDLTYGSGQAQLELFSGDAAETLHASVYTDDSIPGRPSLNLFPPQLGNGQEQVHIVAGTATVPAIFAVETAGMTLPTGYAIDGLVQVGGAATDVWTLEVSNTNKINTAFPGLVVGDNFTPGNRLLISTNEIAAETGAGLSTPLYLNDSVDNSYHGTLLSRDMRHASGFDATQYNPTNAYTNPTTISMVIPCPASGVATVLLKFCVVASAAVVIGDFLVGSITITNSRLGVVFAASDNRGAEIDGNWIGTNAGDITTLSYNLTATALGAAGDTLTITPRYRQGTTGHYNIKKTEMSAIPSL